MSTIEAQLEYAITQPWFSLYVKNLKNSDFTKASVSIADAFRWNSVDEPMTFWGNIEYEIGEKCGNVREYSVETLIKLIETKYPEEQHPELYL